MNIKRVDNKIYSVSPLFWDYLLLVMLSFAFLLSDWVILYSSFGDFILAAAILLMFSLGQTRLSNKQIKFIFICLLIILFSSLLSYSYDSVSIETTNILFSSIKISFYLVSSILFYDYISDKKLKLKLLQVSNIFAAIAIIMGLIIIVIIHSGFKDVLDTVWMFTRTDGMSYYFIGNFDIVRARSLFAEPAHFGYYLNIIFFSNVFYKKKSNIFMLVLLFLGILFTLSYSMLLIFFATTTAYLAQQIYRRDFVFSKWYLWALIPVVAVVFYFSDFIYVTIVQRTLNIVSGEDGSAYNRLLGSWEYVTRDRLLFGNGIGHTPNVTNIYAYIMSDFGLIGMIPYLGITLFILVQSFPAFVLFLLMNSAKGGYLNPMYWIFLLFVFLYGIQFDNVEPLSNIFKKVKS